MYAVVEHFSSVVNFIRLFRDNLLRLDLSFIHVDTESQQSLVYIDGNVLFNELLIHMIKLEKFHFSVATYCLCDQQMDPIIKSFQTRKKILSLFHLIRRKRISQLESIKKLLVSLGRLALRTVFFVLLIGRYLLP